MDANVQITFCKYKYMETIPGRLPLAYLHARIMIIVSANYFIYNLNHNHMFIAAF